MQKELIFQEFEDLKKAVILLEASIKKYKPYKIHKIYTPEELEYYDSLSFRFEKSIELTLSFLKGLEMFTHARISDTLRDRLLNMQKIEIIDDVDFWFEARILRNKIAHAYITEELKDLYNEIYERSKVVFETLKRIEMYLAKKM
ncbi:MAG: nucleotidyltransferase substrate binding protein [bacterium]